MSKKLQSRLLIGSIGLPLIAFMLSAPYIVVFASVLILAVVTYNEALELVHDKILKIPYFLGIFTIFAAMTPVNIWWLHLIFNPSTGIICFLFIIGYDIIKNLGFAKTSQHFFIIIYLSLGFFAIVNLLQQNRLFTIFIIMLIWTFDTFQYFVGKTFGRTKIFKVSPNKSLEGLVGGAIITIIFYVIWFLLFRWLELKFGFINGRTLMYKNFFVTNDLMQFFITFIKIVPALIFFGVFGDLLISQMKRSFEVKDSSNLLGEHGGLLDRLDSVISVCIAVYVLLFTL